MKYKSVKNDKSEMISQSYIATKQAFLPKQNN